jgi:class 3 adenylate cyclase
LRPSLTPESAGSEERKLATVLFADLAGSTELAMRVDAEHLRALLADVYSELSQAAAAFGGTVEKFIGDAVMAGSAFPSRTRTTRNAPSARR